jgi:hypothetical protein
MASSQIQFHKIVRLDRVRTVSHNLGYGVGDDMDDLLAKHLRT